MPCCRGCCGKYDPDAPLVEVNLLEAGEYSLKIGVRLPRSFLRRRAVQLLVATLGGPELDILGPKKERGTRLAKVMGGIRMICKETYVSYNGGRLVHQVKELLPDTRYTVEVSLADGLLEPAKLEARTAPATTCQTGDEASSNLERRERMRRRIVRLIVPPGRHRLIGPRIGRIC
eukprot:g2040.t1